MSLLKVCAVCGELSDGPRCSAHALHPTTIKASARARGYGGAWRKLSERARRLQPWCSDCGATADLTVDHSPEAWRRHAAGLPIRLEDVDVVCRGCNSRRGAARGEGVNPARRDPMGKAKFASEIEAAL